MGVRLPDGWEESIASRSRFILENSEKEVGDNLHWFDLLREVSAQKNGMYLAWIALTGCYPDKFEYQEFATQEKIGGFPNAINGLLESRSKSEVTARHIATIELVNPKFSHIVDVTHTSANTFLTGIQRVVFGVTDGAANISTCVWKWDAGIIHEQKIQTMKISPQIIHNLGWRIRLVRFMHELVPKLEKTRIGTRLRNLILPIARKFKYRLLASDVNKQLEISTIEKSVNVFILNSVITIPEIPATLRHIYLYELILENEITPVQIILYDFIPFFHAWTVHFENRAHLSSYIRLVLLANRIISISSLVHEQAKLITQAFNLERKEWGSRKQHFSFLALPSGLEKSFHGEFQKQENLIVMAGSLEPRKNHLQFLSAIELLVKDGIKVKARILGSAGWSNNHILDKIHDLQKKGIDIQRIGKISDLEMRKTIAEAQVLLQISEAEGFGLPIAEALALGTRVIVSNIRPLNEWKNTRVTIVELGDVEQLKVELGTILSNPESEGQMFAEEITWKDWHQLLFGEKSAF
jgi:glycosyltransferase involved in cell wall biosynthesis